MLLLQNTEVRLVRDQINESELAKSSLAQLIVYGLIGLIGLVVTHSVDPASRNVPATMKHTHSMVEYHAKGLSTRSSHASSKIALWIAR